MIRVAVVDDNPETVALVRIVLRMAGYDVVAEARNGEQAVRAILEAEPDVVVLDRRLPDFNGEEVLRRIRAAGSSTKVVMYSGSDPAIPQADPLADSYLKKSADTGALVTEVRRIAPS